MGAGAAGLIADALTRLSKLTKAEFSPRKDCGVFLTAPVLRGRLSPSPPKSKGSGEVVLPGNNVINNFVLFQLILYYFYNCLAGHFLRTIKFRIKVIILN